MIGIYKITNPKGKIYIGQSIDIEKRFKQYQNLHTVKQIKLDRSLIKYGYDNHIFELIEECIESELNNRERYYQEYYNSVNNGLNCKYVQSDEKSGKLSKETKTKIIKALIGRKHSEETKKLIGSYHKNKIVSDETREKMRNNNLGKIISDEQKRKVSEKLSKLVLDLSTGIFYYSVKEASYIFNININTLRSKLNGTLKNNTNLIYV
jgi:group I intron endonuclease